MPARYAKTRDIAAKYDGTANEHYDLRYKDVQFQKYDLLLAHAERLLGSGEARQLFRDVVVDSGCGSGLLVTWLAERRLLGGVRFVGVDVSGGMLAVARRKAQRRPGTDFIQATAELPPLRDAVAAIAFSISTYQNLDNTQQVLYIPALRKILRARDTLFLFSFLAKSVSPDELASITDQVHEMFSLAYVVPDDRRIEDWLLIFADL